MGHVRRCPKCDGAQVLEDFLVTPPCCSECQAYRDAHVVSFARRNADLRNNQDAMIRLSESFTRDLDLPNPCVSASGEVSLEMGSSPWDYVILHAPKDRV